MDHLTDAQIRAALIAVLEARSEIANAADAANDRIGNFYGDDSASGEASGLSEAVEVLNDALKNAGVKF